MNVNAIMPFSILVLLWLGLTVAALSPGPSLATYPHIRERKQNGPRSSLHGIRRIMVLQLAVRVLACVRERTAARYRNGHASGRITVHVGGPAPMPWAGVASGQHMSAGSSHPDGLIRAACPASSLPTSPRQR